MTYDKEFEKWYKTALIGRESWKDDAHDEMFIAWQAARKDHYRIGEEASVWDGAPEWVNAARVRFFVNGRNDGHSEVFSRTYTRELPKTRVGWLLENPACPFRVCPLWDNDADGKCGGERHGGSAQESCLWYADYESALNKYAEELTKKETN